MKTNITNFLFLIFGHDVERVSYDLSKDEDFVKEAPNFI